MLLRIFFITVIILALAFLGLGIQTFFSKKKSFPQTRISKNKEMRKRNIYCAESEQKMIDKDIKSSCKNCN